VGGRPLSNQEERLRQVRSDAQDWHERHCNLFKRGYCWCCCASCYEENPYYDEANK
jgi:hypothetical protein